MSLVGRGLPARRWPEAMLTPDSVPNNAARALEGTFATAYSAARTPVGTPALWRFLTAGRGAHYNCCTTRVSIVCAWRLRAALHGAATSGFLDAQGELGSGAGVMRGYSRLTSSSRFEKARMKTALELQTRLGSVIYGRRPHPEAKVIEVVMCASGARLMKELSRLNWMVPRSCKRPESASATGEQDERCDQRRV
jgi:hypothetical protein